MYNPLNVIRYFGRACRIHLQGQRTSEARNQHEAGGKLIPVLVGKPEGRSRRRWEENMKMDLKEV
jgi:hypothetical protein